MTFCQPATLPAPPDLPRHAIPSAVQIIPPVSVWQPVILATAGSEVGSELSRLFEPHRGWIEELFLALELNDESGKKGVLGAL